MAVEIIGWVGFAILIAAWIPQTVETVKKGETQLHIAFIIMYFTSSVILTAYSIIVGDTVFIALNALLSLGSGINLFFKLFPRKKND